MTEGAAGTEGSPPRAPEDPRSSYSQILRLQERLRHDLLKLQADIDSPAVKEMARSLEANQGSQVSAPLVRLRTVLDEMIRSVEHTAREVAAELERFQGGGESSGSSGASGLPEGLARFVSERAAFPGFSFETSSDPVRGCVLRWRETLETGEVRASGLLYERPYDWSGD